MKENENRIVLGVFNGENMLSEDGRAWPLSQNYASKSRLVQGDRLKLIIQPNGNFIFKQIAPVPRMKVTGKVTDTFQIFAAGNTYNILGSSIHYFKLDPGDEVVVILPEETYKTCMWAAVDNVIH